MFPAVQFGVELMRDRRRAGPLFRTWLVLIVALSASAVPSPTPAVAKSAGPISKSVRAKLLSIGLSQAVSYREHHPHGISAVLTSRRQADSLFAFASKRAKHTFAYVVAMRGHFTAIRHPQGVRTPRGPVLVVVVDARTLVLTEVYLQRRYPSLKTLGKPVRLRL
jgi:uncharacterized membrane protein YhhN